MRITICVLFVLFFVSCNSHPARHSTTEAIKSLESGNCDDAFQLILPPAYAGYMNAQEILGVLYATGCGTEEDMGQAIRWLTYAADQGSKAAFDVLADEDLSGQRPRRKPINSAKAAIEMIGMIFLPILDTRISQ